MTSENKPLKTLTALFLSATLFACGGGGSDSESSKTLTTPEESPETLPTNESSDELVVPSNIGVIYDSPVDGLKYISTSSSGDTKTGFTNAKGEYLFYNGGATSFYVGDIFLATGQSDQFLTFEQIIDNDVSKQNVLRFLQTLDSDYYPDNGIQIPAFVNDSASGMSIDFSDDFETQYEGIRTQLYSGSNSPRLVSVEEALAHSEKGVSLSALESFSVYKALNNKNNYRGRENAWGVGYYNSEVLEANQRKRLLLWLWEKIGQKEFDVLNELGGKKLADIESDHALASTVLSYAEAMVSLSAVKDKMAKMNRLEDKIGFKYKVTNVAELGLDACKAAILVKSLDGQVTEKDSSFCDGLIASLGFTGTSSVLDSSNKILADFLPNVITDVVMEAMSYDFVKNKGKSIIVGSKPDYASLAIDIAKLSNDVIGATRLDMLNSNFTSYLVAKEYLSAFYRSGMKPNYMSRLIDHGNVTLRGVDDLTHTLAIDLGSSGALCDFSAWITIDKVTCEHTYLEVNYDQELVVDLINQSLRKMTAMYSYAAKILGPISDENTLIGSVGVDLVGLYSVSSESTDNDSETDSGSESDNNDVVVPLDYLTVSGTVIDPDGNPVFGATVSSSIGSNKTTTDVNGKFTLVTDYIKDGTYDNQAYSINVETPAYPNLDTLSEEQVWGEEASNVYLYLNAVIIANPPVLMGSMDLDKFSGGFVITWPNATGEFDEYTLKRNGTKIYSGTELSFIDNLTEEGFYRYSLVACKEEDCSNYLAVSSTYKVPGYENDTTPIDDNNTITEPEPEPEPVTAPRFISGVHLELKSNGIKTSWKSASKTSNSNNTLRYYLYRSESAGELGNSIHNETGTTNVDTAVTLNQRYYYTVAACDGVDNCTLGTQDYIVFALPSFNSGVELKKQSWGIKLRCNLAQNNVTEYRFFRSDSSDSKGSQIGTVVVDSASSTFLNSSGAHHNDVLSGKVNKGVTLWYTAEACNALGCITGRTNYHSW